MIHNSKTNKRRLSSSNHNIAGNDESKNEIVVSNDSFGHEGAETESQTLKYWKNGLTMSLKEYERRYKACWTKHFKPSTILVHEADDSGVVTASKILTIGFNSCEKLGYILNCVYCKKSMILTSLGSSGNQRRHFENCCEKPKSCTWKQGVVVESAGIQ